MHRVELKALLSGQQPPTVPAGFLMHRVELKAFSFFYILHYLPPFLMHRVELKVVSQKEDIPLV